jgi:phage-related minor tail protein
MQGASAVEPLFSAEALIGVRSRFGSLRTLAASHHQGNQRTETLRTRYILGGNCAARDTQEINCLSVLGVRENPLIDVTP